MSYIVYGRPQSRAGRVIWVLEELEQPYEIVPVAPQSDQIKAVNPLGKLPALADGDELLTESLAISQYLADKHETFTFKAGTLERARQDEWIHWASDMLEAQLWMAAKHGFILPEEKRVTAVKPALKADFERGLRELEMMWTGGPYLQGEEPTIADFNMGFLFGWAQSASFELPEEGIVFDYAKRLMRRKAAMRLLRIYQQHG